MDSRGERWVTALRERGFRGALRPDEPLASYTTWRIGGPAELMATPLDLDDLRTALRFTHDAGVPWMVLGNGSNLLVLDTGVRGLILRLRRVFDEVHLHGTVLDAGAGASFPAVANLAASHGLAGIEFGAGVPGTVGGAIRMNAGWHEHEIGDVTESVEFLEPDGSVSRIPRDSCGFGYRTSIFKSRRGIIVGARLDLREDDREAVCRRLESYTASRKANQPTDLPSCGSVFLKPPGDFAGRLIEAAGLKGAREGGVEVSSKHANFIVNLGNGTSRDVLALVRRIEETVERQFGVRLMREFEIWGE